MSWPYMLHLYIHRSLISTRSTGYLPQCSVQPIFPIPKSINKDLIFTTIITYIPSNIRIEPTAGRSSRFRFSRKSLVLVWNIYSLVSQKGNHMVVRTLEVNWLLPIPPLQRAVHITWQEHHPAFCLFAVKSPTPPKSQSKTRAGVQPTKAWLPATDRLHPYMPGCCHRTTSSRFSPLYIKLIILFPWHIYTVALICRRT